MAQAIAMARSLADASADVLADAAWLRADWPVAANIRALVTLRGGPGQSPAPFYRFNLGNARAADGDDAGIVASNRAALIAAARLPDAPRWLRQVHRVDVLRNPHAATATRDEPVADAAVTAMPGTVLAILSADCLPVVFAARDGGEVAAAHAGWRGLAAGVLERTVAEMHARPSDIVVWLGPAAGPLAYEVGAEVRDAFVSVDSLTEAAFSATRHGHWHVDLYALARRRLASIGVTDVHGGDLCTIRDASRFYSYRRDGRTGRMATLVWMQP